MTDPPDTTDTTPTPVQDDPREARPAAGRGVSDLTRVAWVLIGGGAALVIVIVLLILLLV